MTEEQICPRRDEGGVGANYPTPDYWIDNRWAESFEWPEGFGKRACTYCGGIHPEDAITLLENGWEVDPTDKSYKRYLNPPGTRNRRNMLLRAVKRGDENPLLPSIPNPGPPVKVYTQHFNNDQIERFNAALRK